MRGSQKIEKNNHFVSANLKNEKQQWDNFSNFVAFSQYLNFKNQNTNLEITSSGKPERCKRRLFMLILDLMLIFRWQQKCHLWILESVPIFRFCWAKDIGKVKGILLTFKTLKFCAKNYIFVKFYVCKRKVVHIQQRGLNIQHL